MDDILKATHTAQVPAVEKEIWYQQYTNGSDDIYVDWVLVRNCVSPEPSAAVGEEETSIEEEVIELPITFSLFQNYPNPFNPGTTIKFDLPLSSHVTLVIYNLIGQKVATLVDRPMEAGYGKEVRFDAFDIPSGIYFCKLSAGDFVAVKKMVVMK